MANGDLRTSKGRAISPGIDQHLNGRQGPRALASALGDRIGSFTNGVANRAGFKGITGEGSMGFAERYRWLDRLMPRLAVSSLIDRSMGIAREAWGRVVDFSWHTPPDIRRMKGPAIGHSPAGTTLKWPASARRNPVVADRHVVSLPSGSVKRPVEPGWPGEAVSSEPSTAPSADSSPEWETTDPPWAPTVPLTLSHLMLPLTARIEQGSPAALSPALQMAAEVESNALKIGRREPSVPALMRQPVETSQFRPLLQSDQTIPFRPEAAAYRGDSLPARSGPMAMHLPIAGAAQASGSADVPLSQRMAQSRTAVGKDSPPLQVPSIPSRSGLGQRPGRKGLGASGFRDFDTRAASQFEVVTGGTWSPFKLTGKSEDEIVERMAPNIVRLEETVSRYGLETVSHVSQDTEKVPSARSFRPVGFAPTRPGPAIASEATLGGRQQRGERHRVSIQRATALPVAPFGSRQLATGGDELQRLYQGQAGVLAPALGSGSDDLKDRATGIQAAGFTQQIGSRLGSSLPIAAGGRMLQRAKASLPQLEEPEQTSSDTMAEPFPDLLAGLQEHAVQVEGDLRGAFTGRSISSGMEEAMASQSVGSRFGSALSLPTARSNGSPGALPPAEPDSPTGRPMGASDNDADGPEVAAVKKGQAALIESGGTAAGGATDLEALARDVYQVIKHRLAVERERELSRV